ncbi:MAG: hypothetical protein ACYDHX_07865 [Methanothrix sp.]
MNLSEKDAVLLRELWMISDANSDRSPDDVETAGRRLRREAGELALRIAQLIEGENPTPENVCEGT